MIKMTEFATRRAELMSKVGAKGVVILPAAPVYHRNGDTDYPYRQHSDFYYLTGFEEPEAVAVLLPNSVGGEFVLFSRVRDRAEEVWTGYRAGQEGARQVFKANKAFPIQEFEKILPDLLEDREEIHYTLGIQPQFDELILRVVNKLRGKIRRGVQSPFAFVDVAHTIHELRLLKSPAEVELMRQAADISAIAHQKAMQVCKPGMYEYELDAELAYEFKKKGALHVAYSSIVGSGPNTCILHYNDNNRLIEDHSLVLIDAGCEYQYYASDITRTFPANGRFSAEQKAIYELVLAAQLAAIKAIKPGAVWIDAQTVIVDILVEGLLDLGILKGKKNEIIDKQLYHAFYMHNSGHWLGLDVHDVGCYKIGGAWRQLEPGMVLTVEPGIYISADSPGVDSRWHNIGVRIEDDVLVTPEGNDVLSTKAPKSINEIEAIMK